VQEGTGPVSGQKALQLSAVGFVERATYECGQLSELGSSWFGEASCGMGAEIREAAVNVSPGRECGFMGAGRGAGGRRQQRVLPTGISHALSTYR
jgi:hypothetical protein